MIKSILFKGTIRGSGIVNYDGKDQKRMLMRHKRDERGTSLKFENFKVAKHSFIKKGVDDNGNAQYEVRLKISSACLRNAIFQEDIPFQNPMIMHSKKLLNASIASVASLLRGYMFEQEGVQGLKRKSPVIITDAEQTAGGLSTIDLHSSSAAKRTKGGDDDTSDTSLFFKETVGDVEYIFKGAVNLIDLQFISLSDMFDRMAVNPDCFETLYRPNLERGLGSKVEDPGFYLIKHAVNALPEEGVLLSQTQTVLLIREFFKRLLTLNITRSASGYASLADLQIKFVHDPIADKMDDAAGWVNVSKMDDIKINAEDIIVAFSKISKDEANSLMEDMVIEIARMKEIKQESRAKKAAAKKGKRNAQESVDD